jgi:hypothetical protein
MKDEQTTAPWEDPIDVAEAYWTSAGRSLSDMGIAESASMRKMQAVLFDHQHTLGQLIAAYREMDKTIETVRAIRK